MNRQNERSHEILDVPGGVPVRSWTLGVPFEEQAREQVRRIALLPFVYKWVAVMPDVHAGLGATVGSVIATSGAVMPAAVGVDIGCGMMAVRTTLRASDLPEDRKPLRGAIERAVPHGRTNNGGRGDKGAWSRPPAPVREAWARLEPGYQVIVSKYPKIDRGPSLEHLGTLGTGNHFIEVCIDETEQVWLMLHSGSRGVGNRIGSDFVELAKREARRWFLDLADPDLAYFPEGTELFEDYLHAVTWAQEYAAANRELMMSAIVEALGQCEALPPFALEGERVNCHHNYVARENHYGKNVLVTRKGAVRARAGDLGIIPGSMGARSYITRGLGSSESFTSCSHGAGRAMSRTAAKKGVHGRRPRARDRRHRVPQGRRRSGRDAWRLQVDRRGHGGAARSGRGRSDASPSRLCEGVAMALLEINGASGEGGGQILRSSLALSLVTGTPFRIVNIRAGRRRSGLMRQHLTAVQAAAAVGQARVTGAEVGSLELSFHPP